MINTDERKIDELLSRGVEEVIDFKDLKDKLLSGKKLRVKLGIDPTSANIHIGRAVLLWKLRAFQDLGHTAVFIIGDSTGVVGDTSDKDAERPMLTKDQVKSNMKTYFDQVFKILDKRKTETYHNSKWLSKLGLHELATIANLFGLNEFSSRDVIARRLEAGQRVSMHELLYPIMQGYDSVMVKADVELGGRDQRFNLLTGRRIQPIYKQEPQNILMMEILEGTDGRKMSSSWGNGINLKDSPDEMYGKIMSVHDDLIIRYFELATQIPMEKIAEYKSKLASGENPKEIKIILAKEIVKMYHDESSANKAHESWEETFSKGGIPENVEEISVTSGTKLKNVLAENKIVESNSEFTRLLSAGAIKNAETDEKIVSDTEITQTQILKVGKRRFVKVIIK